MTVGILLKKPPLAIPLIIAKAVRGPRDVDSSHSTRMLKALISSETSSVLIGPAMSQAKPQSNRPTAEARLKAARKPAEATEEKPRRLVYRGKKNGGTKSVKTVVAPARKRRV